MDNIDDYDYDDYLNILKKRGLSENDFNIRHIEVDFFKFFTENNNYKHVDFYLIEYQHVESKATKKGKCYLKLNDSKGTFPWTIPFEEDLDAGYFTSKLSNPNDEYEGIYAPLDADSRKIVLGERKDRSKGEVVPEDGREWVLISGI